MRILIDDIPGGYDANTLHAEIDQAADLKPYAIWWPQNPGDPIRVEIEREVPGVEAILESAASRAAIRTPAERIRRVARERDSRLINLEMHRGAAERLGLSKEAARLASEIATLGGVP